MVSWAINRCLAGSCTNTSTPTLPLCYFWFQHGPSRTHSSCWGCANIELFIGAQRSVLLSSAKFIFLAPPINSRKSLADCFSSLQLKTQLTETLSKLEAEENERQKVAGDLYKVMPGFNMPLVWSWDLQATLITRMRWFNPGPAVSWPHSGGALQSDRQ